MSRETPGTGGIVGLCCKDDLIECGETGQRMRLDLVGNRERSGAKTDAQRPGQHPGAEGSAGRSSRATGRGREFPVRAAETLAATRHRARRCRSRLRPDGHIGGVRLVSARASRSAMGGVSHAVDLVVRVSM